MSKKFGTRTTSNKKSELDQARLKAEEKKAKKRLIGRLKEMVPMSQADIELWVEENDYDLEEVWDATDEQ
jgi:hypothetical protein